MSFFDNHLNFYTDKIEALSLILQCKLLLYNEESWTDLNQGIPYLLLKARSIKQEISSQILDTKDVLSVKEIEVIEDRDKIKIKLTVNTTYGDIYVTRN